MRRSRLISAATAAALSFGVTVAATATTAQAATPATAASTDQSAVDALHAAEALFAPTATPFDSSGSAGAGSALKPDPTTTLAALAHVVGQLSGADRRTARAILARPTDGSSDPYHFGWSKSEIKAGHATCGPDLCVHWTDAVGGADDPRAADVRDADLTRGAGNGIPDQVDYTLHEMEHVWATEVTSYGYNAPKADNKGENLPDSNTDLPKIDIYLADVGAAGYYGFCAPEQNRRQSFGFCVLDNDYAPREFGHANTPLDNLRVTAAHEFFHDVQFNYDSAEDAWFMEATAAWMEDEVYPTVNDNLQYLKDSPFHYSYQSLDLRDRGYLSTYGSWVFFRFLSERYGRAIVRTAWQDAVGPDVYSLRAVERALKTHHTDLATQFADFSAANRAPKSFYLDGGLYARYVRRPVLTERLGGAKQTTKWLVTSRMKHLTSMTLGLVPVKARGHLEIEIVGPAAATRPAARLVIHKKNGSAVVQRVRLVRGEATVRAVFGHASIARVDVVLVNASDRTTCHRGTRWSCGGVPTDDSSVFHLRATKVA